MPNSTAMAYPTALLQNKLAPPFLKDFPGWLRCAFRAARLPRPVGAKAAAGSNAAARPHQASPQRQEGAASTARGKVAEADTTAPHEGRQQTLASTAARRTLPTTAPAQRTCGCS